MSSKINIVHNGEFAAEVNNNRMRQRELLRMNALSGLGNFSNLSNGVRQVGPPLPASYLQDDMVPGTPLQSSVPPLPPRNDIGSMNRYRYSGYPAMNRFSGMNSLYSPYSPSRYSSLYSGGLYSPMSSYRMPYGHYGAPNDAYNSFVQMAEESTRPAFESIESVVHVVNSISMMLESTYGAVHSSYSAILGVVDQFSRLKDHLGQIFSVLALIRGLHWLCLKVLYLLGLRKTNPSVEEAWQTARKAAATGVYPSNANRSAWPFFMFLSLVVGAPWLMFKLLSKSVAKKPFDPNIWHNSRNQKYISVAAYDFAATQPGELSFRAGERLTLLPRDVEAGRHRQKGWIMVCNEKMETGLVPSNYMRSSRSNSRQNPEQPEIRPQVLALQNYGQALQNYGQSTSTAVEQYDKNIDAEQTMVVPDNSRPHVLKTLKTDQQPSDSMEGGESSDTTAVGDKNVVTKPSDIIKENVSLKNPSSEDLPDSANKSEEQQI